MPRTHAFPHLWVYYLGMAIALEIFLSQLNLGEVASRAADPPRIA